MTIEARKQISDFVEWPHCEFEMNPMKNHGRNRNKAISPFDEIRKLFLNQKIVSKSHFATQSLCLITRNFGQLHTMVMSLS